MPWRSLQATTLVGAVRRALGRSPARAGDAVVGGPSSGPPRVSGHGPGPEVAAAVRARARWAQLPAPAAERLAERWPELPATVRQQVAAPFAVPPGGHVLWGDAVARQADATTCGAAVLAMLAAAGDPGLALWLATGEELPGYEVPELRRVRPGAVARTPGQRFVALQGAVRHVTNGGVLGWPGALGTPPWGAVRAARFGPVRFAGEMVDDADRPGTAHQLDRAGRALAAGIPVPMYVQGDLGGGLSHAVPRHVVLLTGVEGEDLLGYEPSQGVVVRLPRSALLDPAGPRRELGGWSHAAWLLLPRPAP